MKSIFVHLWSSLRLILLLALLTGIIYPLLMLAIGQWVFPFQANGSLLKEGGQVIGSRIIGQQFTSAAYFQGRPSATVGPLTGAAEPYNAANSGAANLAPGNPLFIQQARASVHSLILANHLTGDNVPVDAITSSGSGLDPDISLSYALLQVNRVAGARHLAPSAVRTLVMTHVAEPYFGIWGEEYINVLELNLALNKLVGTS